MILVNLFTFSSKYARYLAAIIIITMLWVCLLYALIKHNKNAGLFIPHENLYVYQINKIEKADKDINTIFIGDSSLGNVINAKLWRTLSSQKSLNLALTASYGYEGAYNILRHALFYKLHPKNVVIMFNLEQMRNDVSYLAFVQTSPIFWDKEIPLLEVAKLYWITMMNGHVLWFNLVNFVETKKLGKQHINDIANDYIMQGGTSRKENRFIKDFFPYTIHDINPKKTLFLKRIKEICIKEKLNCIYAHGPMVNERCKDYKEYQDKADSYIKASGFRIVKDTPVCVPSRDMGDSSYHVHPEVKGEYTKKYFKLIRNYLQ